MHARRLAEVINNKEEAANLEELAAGGGKTRKAQKVCVGNTGMHCLLLLAVAGSVHVHLVYLILGLCNPNSLHYAILQKMLGNGTISCPSPDGREKVIVARRMRILRPLDG
jgi:hypothetical protein